MNQLRAILIATAALATAQPALATRNLEGLVLQTFLQRCLTPMQKGAVPDLGGLTLPDGSAELGTPGAPELRLDNVDGPMSLRVQTLPRGVTSCALSLDLPEGFDPSQINTALFGNLTAEGFKPVASCETDTITQMYVAEGPAAPDGRRIGVVSFVIVLGDLLPDQLSLIAAESDQPLPPDTNCANQPGEPQ